MTQSIESGQTILVTGATGRQGGAVVDALLSATDRNWHVRALTRDQSSEKAQNLRSRGVEVVQGDQEDTRSLDAAVAGVHGVFSVQLSMDFEAENRQARNLADAAKRARVSQIVATLSAGVGMENTGLARFASKQAIATYLQELGVPLTILRPTGFMENFLGDRAAIVNGTVSGAISPTTRMWYIAVADIGAFAGAAFAAPDKFNGAAIFLAGDSMTGTKVAQTFSRVVGRPVEYRQTPRAEMERTFPAERLALNDWYDREGYGLEVAALRAEWPSPPLMTLAEWLRTSAWSPAKNS